MNNSGWEHGHRKPHLKYSAAKKRLHVSLNNVDAPSSADFSSNPNKPRFNKRNNPEEPDAVSFGLLVSEIEGSVPDGSYGSNGSNGLRSNTPRGSIAKTRSVASGEPNVDVSGRDLSKLTQRPTLPHREHAKRKGERVDRPEIQITPEVKALNKRIAVAETAEEILVLYEKNGSQYNGINLCT
eukprot:803850-Pyramimonas_sp.AAC.1